MKFPDDKDMCIFSGESFGETGFLNSDKSWKDNAKPEILKGMDLSPESFRRKLS